MEVRVGSSRACHAWRPSLKNMSLFCSITIAAVGRFSRVCELSGRVGRFPACPRKGVLSGWVRFLGFGPRVRHQSCQTITFFSRARPRVPRSRFPSTIPREILWRKPTNTRYICTGSLHECSLISHACMHACKWAQPNGKGRSVWAGHRLLSFILVPTSVLSFFLSLFFLSLILSRASPMRHAAPRRHAGTTRPASPTAQHTHLAYPHIPTSHNTAGSEAAPPFALRRERRASAERDALRRERRGSPRETHFAERDGRRASARETRFGERDALRRERRASARETRFAERDTLTERPSHRSTTGTPSPPGPARMPPPA